MRARRTRKGEVDWDGRDVHDQLSELLAGFLGRDGHELGVAVSKNKMRPDRSARERGRRESAKGDEQDVVPLGRLEGDAGGVKGRADRCVVLERKKEKERKSQRWSHTCPSSRGREANLREELELDDVWKMGAT